MSTDETGPAHSEAQNGQQAYGPGLRMPQPNIEASTLKAACARLIARSERIPPTASEESRLLDVVRLHHESRYPLPGTLVERIIDALQRAERLEQEGSPPSLKNESFAFSGDDVEAAGHRFDPALVLDDDAPSPDGDWRGEFEAAIRERRPMRGSASAPVPESPPFNPKAEVESLNGPLSSLLWQVREDENFPVITRGGAVDQVLDLVRPMMDRAAAALNSERERAARWEEEQRAAASTLFSMFKDAIARAEIAEARVQVLEAHLRDGAEHHDLCTKRVRTGEWTCHRDCEIARTLAPEAATEE